MRPTKGSMCLGWSSAARCWACCCWRRLSSPLIRRGRGNNQVDAHASLTRIVNSKDEEFSLEEVPRDHWRTVDYLVGEVLDAAGLKQVELNLCQLAS